MTSSSRPQSSAPPIPSVNGTTKCELEGREWTPEDPIGTRVEGRWGARMDDMGYDTNFDLLCHQFIFLYCFNGEAHIASSSEMQPKYLTAL